MLISAFLVIASSIGAATVAPKAPTLTYLFRMNLTVSSTINTGSGPAGTRLAIPITGGTLSGPKGEGKVLPVGADFGAIDALGNFNVDAHSVVQMDDGSYVYSHSAGPLISGPTALDRIKFETGSSKYSWLNEILAVAVTDFPGPWVSLDVWQLLPGGACSCGSIGRIAARRFYAQDRSDQPRPGDITVQTGRTRLSAKSDSLGGATMTKPAQKPCPSNLSGPLWAMASHARATTSPSSIPEGDSTNEQKRDPSPSSDTVMTDDPGQAITGRDPNSKIVGWNGPDDPENPKNWPNRRKWMITVSLGMLTWVVTFASSIFSTATRPAAKEFGVSTEVMTLGTSLFVLGFAFGPLIFGPMSEVYGRKYPLFVGYFVFALFQIPVATAESVQTVLVCRFLSGLFGSSPLSVVGGALVDLWPPVELGIAMSIFAGANFVGPVAGPIMGGFITQSSLGWRWTAYITAIMAALFGPIAFITVPETLESTLLARKARAVRLSTRDWAMHAAVEEKPVDISEMANRILIRPLAMLVLEPVIILVTLYMSFVYGLIYLCFEAYPVSFEEDRGWNSGVGSLPFLAIILGVVIGVIFIIVFSKTRLTRIIKDKGHLPPEQRLIPMMVGGACFPIGLLWFAWTSDPTILWVPQAISGIPLGVGIMLALAANAVVRALFGAGFPMFATAMYKRLGVDWATSVLGFIAVGLFPVPILFYVFGERIRKLSRYAPSGGPP
ncbi:major facilitator superfamily domain-containing protein [Fusarium redolens]|uniref:Major facilitator superfamily domain-containing protein n=1 Tax=Fusarium redolens TaxID=48865 RepID=A0A9P9K1P3_FUSRE|nr:major facilitator superfamily domain-containing protein [Fusarium redolens]KAH7237044.1 major facilitator superfamily domain-containing protein [Fusarium redolens]